MQTKVPAPHIIERLKIPEYMLFGPIKWGAVTHNPMSDLTINHQAIVEKEMQITLDKYPENESDYLLSIIRGVGTNDRNTYRRVGYNISHALKRVAKKVGITMNLTLYEARHSWASAAKSKGIPVSVISEGMGHGSKATTQIYLASLDTSVVDRANSLIFKFLK